MKRIIIITFLLIITALSVPAQDAQIPFAFRCQTHAETDVEMQFCNLAILEAKNHALTREQSDGDVYFFGLTVLAVESDGDGCGLSYGVAVDAFFEDLDGIAFSAYFNIGYLNEDQIQQAAGVLANDAVTTSIVWLGWALSKIPQPNHEPTGLRAAPP